MAIYIAVMESRREKFCHYLDQEGRQFGHALVKAASHPRGHIIHELRTSSRRLRSALGLIRRRKGAGIGKVRRRLRKVAAVAGAERELEVAGDDAQAFGGRIKGLRGRLKRARRHVRQLVTQKRFLKLPAQIDCLAAELRKDPAPDAVAWKKYTAALRRWESVPPESGADFHRLRIAVKKVRYTLEAAESNVGRLKKMQDVLGRVHDLEVLEKFIGQKKNVRRARARYQREAMRKLRRTLADVKNSLAPLG